ncbi:MAG: DoxX family protein [Candidatus Uhrbacteria bacterium]|nr:DoxX family protein [Candidatus Uhrbacteria bacterium]
MPSRNEVLAMRIQTGLGKIAATAHNQMFGFVFAALRIVLGMQFFGAGWSKLTTDWSAAGFLAIANGPFAEWFQSLAGNALVDGLNVWGLMLIGLALVLGFAVRPAAIAGMFIMVLYYLAGFTENTAHGFIDFHVIYFLIFALFACGGAGNVFGLNAVALGHVRRVTAWWKFILG